MLDVPFVSWKSPVMVSVPDPTVFCAAVVARFTVTPATVVPYVRRSVPELPLIVSDHADWNELTATFIELKPEEVWITHGREEGLLRWAEINGQKARALRLVGYDEEDEEALDVRPD